ncbi:PLP-dependent aminotransferase family protein [Streptomyces sp. NPDC007157]|uniref:MocR-like pyridoxine biosynthesis transcription factor PdxR n=1 Tax=Streptomyces sp. NPDC007157 TaxID=3154681 RepID=UPI003408A8EB
MTKFRATSSTGPLSAFGVDLHLELRGYGLRAGLTQALRDAVRTGRLPSGTRLPSSRSLAGDLGVARNTVTDAYAELVAEGWLVARHGSGTRVAGREQAAGTAPPAAAARRAGHRPRFAMLPGTPDLSGFPRKQWIAAARRALDTAPNDALGYGDALGRAELRTALAGYLARVRGVRTDPERIVICSGFHHGLTLMTRVLTVRGVRTVAVEEYGLDLHRNLISDAGLRMAALPVDERGACIDQLSALPGTGAVLLTPAHQYPTGHALSPDRRMAAVDWARNSGGLIIEDDYDGEFRYDRQPVGALQGLDPERVVYCGTASKTLAPGLRLAWMVLPEELVPEVEAAKLHADLLTSALDQLILAELISSGSYDRHVRAMRMRYRRRRDELVTALAQYAPDVRVTGLAAGLQAVVRLPHGTEQAVVEAAATKGLAVSGITPFRYTGNLPRRPLGEDALVVNYAGPSDSAWSGALETLCRVMP